MLPVIIGIVASGLGLWAYEKYIDTDPAPIQNINIDAPPEVGSDYQLNVGGQQGGGAGPGASGAAGALAGLSTGALLALGAGAYFLTKD